MASCSVEFVIVELIVRFFSCVAFDVVVRLRVALRIVELLMSEL